MTYMLETSVPEQPTTAVVAVDHIGLRFNLARQLLREGVFTMLLSDGDCAAHRLGNGAGPVDPPRAVVARCKTAEGVVALLERVETLGWRDTTVFLVDPPEQTREQARRAGAIVVEEDVEPETLVEAVLELMAAA